jgi:hypothetical protein
METESSEDAPLSRWWALPGLAIAVAITAIVHQFASFARAEAAGICSAVLFVITLPLWKCHRERWFWPCIAAAIVVHALAIWLIPWPLDHEFQKSDLIFVWLDFFLYFGAALTIDHFVDRRK